MYSDIEPQAVKTGSRIALPEMMDLIYPYVSKQIPYVMDPVMIATSGDRLYQMRVKFLKIQTHSDGYSDYTKTVVRLRVLADMSIDCESDITTAAHRILRDLGPKLVIIKWWSHRRRCNRLCFHQRW